MFNLTKVEDTKQLELPPIKEGEIYILKKDLIPSAPSRKSEKSDEYMVFFFNISIRHF